MLINQDAKRKDAIRLNDIYAAMVGAFPDCLNVKDTNGRFIAANDATAYLMRAKNAEDLIGKTDFDFFDHTTAQHLFEQEQALMQGKLDKLEDEHYIEHMFRASEHNPGWYWSIKLPLRDRDGCPCASG